MYETKFADKQEINEKIDVVTKHSYFATPHISIEPLTPINYKENIQTNTLLDMEESPFFFDWATKHHNYTSLTETWQ